MGILNVTPDSFSDGDPDLTVEVAVERGRALSSAGADVVDVGGESTRPGATRVPVHVEQQRVLPVIAALAQEGIRVGVDTTRAATALAAVHAGARVVNDVSGGLADPAMAGVVAQTGVTYVAMHWRGPSRTMAAEARYHDVVAEVREELRMRVDALLGAGVELSQIVLDPGIGFAKRPEHDWALLRRLPSLTALGLPVMVGASRKSFLAAAAAAFDGAPRPAAARDLLTCGITSLAVASGASWIRVHDVAANRDAALVGSLWRSGQRR